MPSHKIILGNIEGEFETNYAPIDLDENVICCSFFYIKGAEDKYTQSLTKIIHNFKNNQFANSKYKLRLYYDITTKKYVEENFLNIPYLQLYYYYFPKFFSKKNNSHYGFLGTIVRYLPLFSILKHQVKNCWIIDIDIHLGKHNHNVMEYVQNNPDIQFFHKTRLNYFYDRLIAIKNRSDFAMISSFIFQRNPISSTLLSNFLNDNLLDKKNNIYNQYLKDIIERLNKKKELGMFYKDRIDYNMKPFQYGVDEFFINKDLFHYYRDHKIPIYTTFFHTDIYSGIKMHAELLKLNNVKMTENHNIYMNKVYSLIDDQQKITSIDQYYKLISSDENVSRHNTRSFEKHICLDSNFIKYFKTLNPNDIDMPLYIYAKIILSFKYCFLKNIPILKYIDQKYTEIKRIEFK